MASVLLEKTRKISRLLEKVEKIAYADLSKTLSEVMTANVYLVNRDGKILGYSIVDEFECTLMMEKVLKTGRFPERYVNWLSKVLETSENLTLNNGMCAFSTDTPCIANEKFTTVVPIYGAGERLGTLIVATFNEPFVDDDLILAEYAATVVGIEFLRDRTERIEDDVHRRAVFHERHVFYWHYASDNTLVAMTTSHFITNRNFSHFCYKNLNLLKNSGFKLVSIFAGKPFNANYFTSVCIIHS